MKFVHIMVIIIGVGNLIGKYRKSRLKNLILITAVVWQDYTLVPLENNVIFQRKNGLVWPKYVFLVNFVRVWPRNDPKHNLSGFFLRFSLSSFNSHTHTTILINCHFIVHGQFYFPISIEMGTQWQWWRLSTSVYVCKKINDEKQEKIIIIIIIWRDSV